jgi:hypothetical protein
MHKYTHTYTHTHTGINDSAINISIDEMRADAQPIPNKTDVYKWRNKTVCVCHICHIHTYVFVQYIHVYMYLCVY